MLNNRLRSTARNRGGRSVKERSSKSPSRTTQASKNGKNALISLSV